MLNLAAHRSASALYRFTLLDHAYALLTFAKPRLALAVLDAAEDCSTVPLLHCSLPSFERHCHCFAAPRTAVLCFCFVLPYSTGRRPCVAARFVALRNLASALLCRASPGFAVAVLSPAMLSRRFAGKCVAQLRLRFNAHDCAMPLLCLSLPYSTAAMPYFALIGSDLPCSYKARLCY